MHQMFFEDSILENKPPIKASIHGWSKQAQVHRQFSGQHAQCLYLVGTCGNGREGKGAIQPSKPVDGRARSEHPIGCHGPGSLVIKREMRGGNVLGQDIPEKVNAKGGNNVGGNGSVFEQ